MLCRVFPRRQVYPQLLVEAYYAGRVTQAADCLLIGPHVVEVANRVARLAADYCDSIWQQVERRKVLA